MATLNKEYSEEYPWSDLAQNSKVPSSKEEYINHVVEKNEKRVTTKLSQGFNRTKNCILGELLHFDDFIMNPLTQGHSGTASQSSRIAYGTNQGTNEDDSQSDPHPETGIFQSPTTRNCGPEDGHNMVMGVHEEVTYCPSSTSSGKQREPPYQSTL